MTRILTLLVLVILSAGLGPPAHAQQTQTPPSKAKTDRFEITPFLGYQFGGDLDFEPAEPPPVTGQDLGLGVEFESHAAYAIAFDLRADPQLQYEIFYSRQPTTIEATAQSNAVQVDVEYLHFGGTATLDETASTGPYAVGGLGVTRLSFDVGGGSDVTEFSISVGAGMRVPIKPRFDLRLEARAFLTFMANDSTLFCGSNSTGGTCALRSSGSLFTQFALMAGGAFAF